MECSGYKKDMIMQKILQKIYDIGIIPVIAIDDVDKAVPLAKALVKGGLPAAEITFRTNVAEEAIKRIVKEVPEMLVGAGTILTTEQVDRAHSAGCKFMVSPGFNPEVTKYALNKGINCTRTFKLPNIRSVSGCCTISTSRTKRFNGKRRSMRPTFNSIPMALDTCLLTCLRIKFCTGGTYSNIIIIIKSSMGVRIIHPIHFNILLRLFIQL